MHGEADIITQMSGYVAEIISGTFFLLIGLGAFTIALIRRDKNARILFWLGMWSCSYGLRLLIGCPPIEVSFPGWLQACIPYADVSLGYLILLFALLTWLGFTRAVIRPFLKVMALLSLLVAVAGISWFIFTGDRGFFMTYNNLITTITLFVLIVVICVKRLAERYSILPNRGLLAAATLLFAGEALYSNLARFLQLPTSPALGWLGFAILLSALALSAIRIIFESEKRLLTIENELATARNIQFSILPAPFPRIHNLSVIAAYYPMAAVAGDFYDFLIIDDEHSGFLVADASGHGVPAALIASMIKIAIQSAVDFADDPAKVLKHLANVIGSQLHDHFVTAAYLYVDLVRNKARYSAAGHPPLYYRNAASGQLHMVESNGLLISAFREESYPVAELEIHNGDRFIMYTDGLTEAENREGEQFADKQFAQLLDSGKRLTANELSKALHHELQKWLPDAQTQQDDFTWIIIDVTGQAGANQSV